MSSNTPITCEAIHIERDILKTSGARSNPIVTAASIKLWCNLTEILDVNPLVLPTQRLKDLQDHLLLFFTGVSRTASDIAGDKIKSIPSKRMEFEADTPTRRRSSESFI